MLDYMVLMTYDLQGQWDVGNQWSDPGCPKGNCLRSHINKTETLNSLAMVTKAGVSANKVVVGVASYGHSFKMAESGCTGSQCTFLGDAENTQAEINQILANDKTASHHVDDWESDILVYGGTE